MPEVSPPSSESEQSVAQPPSPARPQSAKDAYDERRQEKRALQRAVGGRDASSLGLRRLLRAFVWLLVLAAIGYGLYALVESNTPESEDMSRAIPEQGREHITLGAPHAPYSSNPPTSGPHYDQPARPGFRDEAIADEYLVHSLEHGLVWVSYHPRVAALVREALREFAGPLVVITAREANETDIALAAWGHLDAFNLDGGALDETIEGRIRDFINRYRNRGPERIPAGQHGGI